MRGPLVEQFVQDLRYGARSLWRDRAFAGAAVFALTIGVGFVVSFFTVFNGLLLKPWPLPRPETVVTGRAGVSPAEFRYLRDGAATIDLVAIAETCGNVVIDDEARPSEIRCVSGTYFSVLGVPLAHGRGFRADEDVAGVPVPVVVISDSLWRDRFARSEDAIGRSITLNRVSFQIVGIAAPGATDRPGPRAPRLWVPLAAYPVLSPDTEFNRAFLFNPEFCCVELAGRLRGSATRAVVDTELTALHRQFAGVAGAPTGGISVVGTSQINQPWADNAPTIIGLLFAGISLVLIVACANTGNLQLARGSRRRNEFLVRLSLGASRGRLVRQLLTEGLVLAGAAAALSLLAASVMAGLLTRWLSGNGVDVGVSLSPDWRAAGCSVALAALAAMATGLGPALSGTRRLLTPGRQAGAAPTRARAWFLVIQVGLSAVLIIGASLLGRGLLEAASLDPGFDAATVARVVANVPRDAAFESRRAAIRDGLRAALTVPGEPVFADAGFVQMRTDVTLAAARPSPIRPVEARSVSPEYLRLLEVPVREGRLLRDDDSPREVVVNESFARRAWPARPAVGAVFFAGGPRVVVGVVGDMRSPGAGVAVRPAFFERGGGNVLLVRHDAAVLDHVRAAVQAIDPRVTVEFELLSADFDRGLAGPRLAVAFAWALGLISLIMAATGIFGVFSLVVEERRREIGIRVALGAGPQAIIRLMLGHIGRALAAGVALGFGAALLATPLLRTYLIGVGPHDPIAFGAAAVVIAVAGAAAASIPVRRALRVDPAVTLRAD